MFRNFFNIQYIIYIINTSYLYCIYNSATLFHYSTIYFPFYHPKHVWYQDFGEYSCLPKHGQKASKINFFDYR